MLVVIYSFFEQAIVERVIFTMSRCFVSLRKKKNVSLYVVRRVCVQFLRHNIFFYVVEL